jgi:hypothetical protein
MPKAGRPSAPAVRLPAEASAADHGQQHAFSASFPLKLPFSHAQKYQLLLKELIRHVGPDADQSLPVQAALASMLDLLAQINADMEQLHILGYPVSPSMHLITFNL